MNIIFTIAVAELKKLFYSPVAWFILVIFTFQMGLTFTGAFDYLVRIAGLGAHSGGITRRTYGGDSGLFGVFASYSYIYLPLVTMGIMSREFSSGTIKLLYASPITNWQVIAGKYLSLMIFGLALVGPVAIFSLFGMVTIVHVDVPQLLGGLLGIYLLICAYAAIGLFVSSLTSYIVVAAIGTVSIFALLNYAKSIGQDIPFVRDVTYWFSLSGRVYTFISGMITSEDVLYYIIVILLFLSLTFIKLRSGRQKVKQAVTAGLYLAVFCVAILLGYISSLPKLKFYKDLTYTKVNTISKTSQQILAKVPDNAVITTYTNVLSNHAFSTLPSSYKEEQKLFENYIRFNPTIKLKYVYFYHKTDNPRLDRLFPKLNDKQLLDTLRNNYDWDFKISPYSDIAKQVNLSSDNYSNVRVIETPDGRKTFLRFFDDYFYVPFEPEISAAFKQLVKDVPTVGFLIGQGERSVSSETDENYSLFSKEKAYRNALINQGLNFEDVSLNKPISQKIKILVIADIKRALTATEHSNLDKYIAGGGNMMIFGEPGKQAIVNSITAQLGVRFLPGTLMHEPGILSATLVKVQPTDAGRKRFGFLDDVIKQSRVLVMPTASGLVADADKGFNVLPWFTTEGDTCWSELQTAVDNVAAQINPNRVVKKQQPKIKTGNDDALIGRDPNLPKMVMVNGKMVNDVAIINPRHNVRLKITKANDPNAAATDQELNIPAKIMVNGKMMDNIAIINPNSPIAQRLKREALTNAVQIKSLNRAQTKFQQKFNNAIKVDPAAHKDKKPYTTVIGLDRMVGKKQQKIIIMGDADWLSNGELNMVRKQMGANSMLSNAMFSWLSDGEAPVDISRPKPIDNTIKINKKSWSKISFVLKWVFPGILMIAGIIIWIRRKGR